MFWSETNISGSISRKVRLQLDYQYRTQGISDDLESQRVSNQVSDTRRGLFTHAYQQVFRPWIAYQASKYFRVSLSPVGWWGTWRPTADNKTTFEPELRTTTQVLFSYPLGRVIFEQRFRYEFRFFGNRLLTDGSQGKDYYSNLWDNTTRKGRLRYMTRIFVPLNQPQMKEKTLYLAASDEIMIGMGSNVIHEKIFDQNRLYVGLGYKFTPQFRLEAGYVNQFQPQKRLADGSKNSDINNVLQVFIVIDDINKILKNL
ncbi:DUF2490 domain-containing protein [Cytophagaceae bacterium DM2B3-1]|uniref:DUF2490 domain-containing protein n=1 Tax=Xanthocytophaga flava TaxID=3048013 RepID=A0ABT7CDS5_9BACT|nr:DUF2490 domain-containing protein [Xanthocytophaga flavus]MDJ1472715.1 DUF2490 domain-containing protein [Xanthocytophaga flavus]MDJ1491895.1 DUF2490 domain-containing protein [Xanthocytophaga flavus]